MKKISAIVACYNDEKAVPYMYQRLTDAFKRIGADYEMIFVNDGSPDNTEKVLCELAEKDSHVIAVNHSRNFGSQMAFTSGMDIAIGDGVVLLDGDLQDPPELIEKFYEKWNEGYDVVYGIRNKREATLFMQIAYKLFYIVFHKLSYVNMPLHAGDFSLIDRRVVEHLKQFTERDRFLRGLRAWVGFRQTGISYARPKRMFGATTNSLLKNSRWATKGIFSFSYVPLELITLLSFCTFLVAIVGMIAQIVLRLLSPNAPQGFTTVLVVVLFIGAIQLLSISIIGQYIGKIFEEVKQRPKYIVKSVFRKG